MSIGFWQILLVVALVVLLFGRGKISDLMGDVAKGIKSFKKGMAEDDDAPRTIDHEATEPMATKSEEKTKVG
jgi:sec-independent protein translocase protein TatA